MPPKQRPMRINLQEFKSRFLKVLGPAKESQYWGLLSSFLTFRLTKAELDRLVPSTIGRENLVLHNQFVRAIFTNVHCAEAPAPPASVHDTSKPVKGIRRKPITAPPGNEEPLPSLGPLSPGLQVARSNGDAFAMSPRKGRSGIRDRKATERPSPLGSNHRGEASTSQGTLSEDETPRALENGNLGSPDLLRPLQQLQSANEHSNLELESPVIQPSKRPRFAYGRIPDGKAGTELVGLEVEQEEEEEEEEDEEEIIWANSAIRPPLGLPFCVASVGGACRVASPCMPGATITHTLLGDALDSDCLEASDLPDTDRMWRRMQQVAVVEHGLQGVSHDCANVLNQALDLYLKRLIKPSIELARSKHSIDTEKSVSWKENGGGGNSAKDPKKEGHLLLQQRRLNGMCNQENMGVLGEAASEVGEKGYSVITPIDFQVAMDLNRQLLGENFPIHLEKILLRVFQERL